MAGETRSYWCVRDTAADSPFFREDDQTGLAGLGLAIRHESMDSEGLSSSFATVLDHSGGDRAVTLAYCVPVDARGWTWWDDPQHKRTITGDGLFINPVDITGIFEGRGCGATGTASRYPLAVAASAHRALVLALPLEPPRLARLLYDPTKLELRAEFDFGLSPIPIRFPSRADAAVLCYDVPAKWAFREALARYYELHPAAFARRVGQAGLWLPFTGLDQIEQPEDFGFAYHELGGLDGIAADKRYGIGSFLYCEPQSYWQTTYQHGGRPTCKGALEQLRKDAEAGDVCAQAVFVSGCRVEDGAYQIYIDPIAWTQSVPFGVDANPETVSTEYSEWSNMAQCEMERLGDALGWCSKPAVGLDGIYIDSIEGWSEIHDHCRDHWRFAQHPLTFSPDTKAVCLLNLWGTYAFVKELARKLHDAGLTLMANDMFYRYWFYAPMVDVPGREYSWFEGGRFAPLAEARYLFFRSMSGKKPYLMLMNNNFSDGSHMEEYFQRSLFYGVFPSMFHAHDGSSAWYWTTPDFYNRDRHLFSKYIPLIRRIDRAGWEPVPHAVVEPDAMLIERFGGRGSDLIFTLHNPTSDRQTVVLKVDLDLCEPGGRTHAAELISGEPCPAGTEEDVLRVELSLEANGYAAVALSSP